MNLKRPVRVSLSILTLLAAVLFTPASPYALTANEIASKSEDVYPGSDQRSKLTFLIRDPDGSERKVILRRYWKNYKTDKNIESKVLVFHEYPPDTKGTSFMVWSYKLAANKPEDLWLYLPILRKVQKVPEHPDEIFSGANLRPADMIPRPMELDKHTLLREETVENQDYYVVESVPKSRTATYPYGKLVKWVTKDNFLKERIDYYDQKGALLKKQITSWKKTGDAWIWEKVILTNVQNNVQTTLSISDTEINTGLSDDVFTERTMRIGPAGR
jgi:outer membrane lipoprotein-sorting protein